MPSGLGRAKLAAADAAARRSARDRWLPSLVATASAALAGLGSLAWVSPRAAAPLSPAAIAARNRATAAAEIRQASGVVGQLSAGVAAQRKEIDQIAATPMPSVGSAPSALNLPAAAPSAGVSVPLGPAVHAMTGASHVP